MNDIYIDVDHLRNVRRQYDDLRMKFIEFFNEFDFEFLLLINQIFKKNETNKIHDLEEKITVKLQHVDVELNDFETLENYFCKFQVMNNKHHCIKNNDVKNQQLFVRERVWLEVIITETCIFDLESKYVQKDRMSKVDCERQTLNRASFQKNFRW